MAQEIVRVLPVNSVSGLHLFIPKGAVVCTGFSARAAFNYKVHTGVCKIFLYTDGPITEGGISGHAMSVPHEEPWEGAR